MRNSNFETSFFRYFQIIFCQDLKKAILSLIQVAMVFFFDTDIRYNIDIGKKFEFFSERKWNNELNYLYVTYSVH